MNNVALSAEVGIRTQDEGFLALAASIIVGAVEDVRIHLINPTLKTKDEVERRCRTKERLQRAQKAATYLQSEDCQELCSLLKACGHPVPMKRFWRELTALKAKQQQTEPLG